MICQNINNMSKEPYISKNFDLEQYDIDNQA